MGQSQASQWKGYEDQLFQDQVLQSYAVPNSAQENSTPIIRHPNAKDGFVGFLLDDNKQELDTSYKLFTVGVERAANKSFVGYRKFLDTADLTKRGDYEYITYKEFHQYVLDFGNGLRSLLNNENYQNIGIYSINRPEWYVCHMGNSSQTYRTAALYDALGADSVAYIIGHAELPVIVCEKNKLRELFKAIVECKKREKAQNDKKDDSDEKNPNSNANMLKFALKYIVQIDYDSRYNNLHEKVDENDKKTASEHGVELLGLSEILAKGKDINKTVPPTKKDIAYIMYTSGTTGDPKGVLLSHQAFSSMVASGQREFNMTPEDTYISYLPLAHIFEAAAQALMSSQGATVSYFQGDIRKISEDFLAIRPTILVGVPRVFIKTYERYNLQVSKEKKLKKWLVESAQKSSTDSLRKGGGRSKIYDSIVWSRVAESIGFNNVRLVVSGAAPLPAHIVEFLRVILPNSIVRQGYGMTETTAGGTVTGTDDYLSGHVGIPLDNVQIRLIDAPECNYFVKDQPCSRGEVQIKGLSVMDGYYKNEEATKSTLSQDGWLSTGDIGRLNLNGTLSIIDRRKNMFKTSHGEYIAAEKLETEYAKAHGITQIWIYGNSFKSFVVAVVVPDTNYIPTLLKEKNLWGDDKQAKFLSNEWVTHYHDSIKKNIAVVKEFLLKEMKRIEKECQLKPFEFVKDIHIEYEIDTTGQAFTIDNGLLTPTFKTKRAQLLYKYIDVLKELYTNNGEAPVQGEEWLKK